MSIEENLKRIADSNDKIVELLSGMSLGQGKVETASADELNKSMTPPAATATTEVPAPPATAVATEVPAPPATAVATVVATAAEVPVPPAVITLESLNDEALAAVKRIGDSGTKVLEVLAEYGAKTLNQVPEDKHAELHTKLQAL